MGKGLLLILFLILAGRCLAESIATGELKVTIVNRPPVITRISISPENAYEDSVLRCVTSIDDESPATAKVSYRWYRNGVPVGLSEESVSGFSGGDTVKCEAVATDMDGASSPEAEASTVILETPQRAMILRPVLRAAGIRASISEISEKTEMSQITGMVTGGGGGSATLLGLLAVFFVILTTINVSRLVSRRWKNM